jgi:pyruvate dehydrogenase kinase 2/3/4
MTRLISKLWEFGRKPPLRISMQELLDFGRNPTKATLINSAVFLHGEIPTRLAGRIRYLRTEFPESLLSTGPMQTVLNMYGRSFETIVSHPDPTTMEKQESLSVVFTDILERHRFLQHEVARGISMVQDIVCDRKEELHESLNAFYTSRIGIRVLMDQHLALQREVQERQHDSLCPPHLEHYVGTINEKCRPSDIIDGCIADAKDIMTQNLYDCDIPMVVHQATSHDITFPYIPEQMQYVLLEILKNSARATWDTHHKDNNHGNPLPSVNIVLSEGKHSVFILVQDVGGGIEQNNIPRIFDYDYTTADRSPNDMFSSDSVIAGFGHGLPLSRLYMKYWGGGIHIQSTEGFGTSVLLRFSKHISGVTETSPL